MNRIVFRRLLPSLLVITLLAACAPMGGPGGGGPGGGPGGGMGRSGRGGEGERSPGQSGGSSSLMVFDQIQLQLRDLAQDLKLTPRQTILWEAYQDKVQALMNDLVRLEPYRPATRGALQQIGGKVEVVRNRLAAMEDIAEAADKLYQTLDAEQRKVADQRLAATVPPLYGGFSGREMEGGRNEGGRGRSGSLGGEGPPGGGRF